MNPVKWVNAPAALDYVQCVGMTTTHAGLWTGRVTQMQFHSWIDLVEQGHYRVNTLASAHERVMGYGEVVPWSTSASGHEWTRACRRRSCWYCQYQARRKMRRKVASWIGRIPIEEYKFVTLTLPGSWYEARDLALGEQHELLTRSFRSWRAKRKYRGRPVRGFAAFEHTGERDGNWHSHIHGVFEWPDQEDLAEVKRTWTESVDRPMRMQLAKWTEGSFTNDSRVLDIQNITSDGIAEYLTKVTNYVTKGSDGPSEASKALYGKRLCGWYGRTT